MARYGLISCSGCSPKRPNACLRCSCGCWKTTDSLFVRFTRFRHQKWNTACPSWANNLLPCSRCYAILALPISKVIPMKYPAPAKSMPELRFECGKKRYPGWVPLHLIIRDHELPSYWCAAHSSLWTRCELPDLNDR